MLQSGTAYLILPIQPHGCVRLQKSLLELQSELCNRNCLETMRFFPWFLVLASVIFVGGCVQHLKPRPQAARNFVPWSDDVIPYHLAAGDSIGLRFILNPELNETNLPIAPDGSVSAPLVGTVMAAGKTVEDLRKDLTERYTAYLREPSPDVLIHAYDAAQIYVGGEVKKQGIYPMMGPTNVMQAVITAGGAIDTTRLNGTILIRRRADGRPMMRVVNLRTYLDTADSQDNVALRPGDIVYVPKTEIGSFDIFIDQYLNKAIPFNRTLNYNLGSGQFW